jgi:DNA recombination protein RmuC
LSVPDAIVIVMELTMLVFAALALVAGLAIGMHIGAARSRSQQAGLTEQLRTLTVQAVSDSRSQIAEMADARLRATEHVVSPVKESLDRFDARLRDIEATRASSQAALKEQIEHVRLTGESLRRETASLSTALRRPSVRGRWGELHLQRAVEIAGLVEHCDFEQQVHTTGDDGVRRPDLVVTLAGGKQVVVDAKVPLDAFLDATSSDDADDVAVHLRRHARQLRTHVDTLAGKAYWSRLPAAPEFVVLFVPGEAFLSAALEADAHLLEYAAGKHVILATPSTLIALLRTVAHAWTQDALADNAREVHAIGRELYDRLGTLGEHLDKLGRSLSTAVGTYNKAIGSLETRVLVSARKFRDLKISDSTLVSPAAVEDAPRQIGAAELLDTEPVAIVVEGSPGREQWSSGQRPLRASGE